MIHKIYIPSMPSFKELKKYLIRIDETKIYSNSGPLNLELISRLSETFGVAKHQMCLVANATLALQGAVAMSNHKGPWSCPSWSFAATGQALLNQKMSFKFVDVDKEWRLDTGILDPDSAVLDVAPFGDEIRKIVPSHIRGPFVVDAAASFDAISSNASIPKHDNFAVILSLHATKLIGAGEGGVFISKNEDWVDKVESWSNFGFTSKSRRSDYVGTNAKMSEYSAAVALASLDRWYKVKQKFLEFSLEARDISHEAGLGVHPAMRNGYVTPYWIIVSEKKRILKIEKLLTSKGIETRRWWSYGMHGMKAFRDVQTPLLDKTNELAGTTLGLPFHLYLSGNYFTIIRELLMKTS